MQTDQSKGGTEGAERREIVFIDGRIQSWSLPESAHAEVVILDAGSNGLEQIAAYLEGQRNVDAIHLVSHGANAHLQIGSLTLDNNSVQANGAQLAKIGQSLTGDGDFLLYGCRVGAGAAGGELMQQIARFTQADVAASADNTGSASLSANWVLERHIGTIASTALEIRLDGVLAAPVSENFDTVPVTGDGDGDDTRSVGASGRAIGGFTMGLLDSGGADLPNSGLTPSLITVSANTADSSLISSTSDKAIFFEGALGIAHAAQIKSSSGDEFSLQSFTMKHALMNPHIKVDGYRDGVLVATHNLSVFAGFTTSWGPNQIVDPDWKNIDEFRILQQDNSSDVLFYMDDLAVASAVQVPQISGASFDVATNVLVVTGTYFAALAGAMNDINVSLLTLTGQGGSYTLTSSDVEITSSTSFAITLNSADSLAVQGLFNRDGTQSSGAIVYNIAAADGWLSNVALSADLTDNPVTVSNARPPQVSSATYDAATGLLVVSGIDFIPALGAADVDVSRLIIVGEGGASHTLTDSADVELSSSSSFSVTLSASDRDAVGLLINKNGFSSTSGSEFSLSTEDDWLRGADPEGLLGEVGDNNINVSNVALPAMTGATYDVGTGVLVVTGTGFSTLVGIDNDIASNKIRFTLEGGQGYTLTDTANVNITSSTSFTFQLSSTDRMMLASKFDQSGTTFLGGTAYNLALLEDWSQASDDALVIADLTGNPINVTLPIVPRITGATYDAASNLLTVTGSDLDHVGGLANQITVSTLTVSGESGSYTLTSADVAIASASAFSVLLNNVDRIAIEGVLNKNGLVSSGAVTYNLGAASGWLSNVTPAADLTANPITVSNTQLPTITAANYDAATGALVVSGTGLVRKLGPANDIDASAFTLTGKDGQSYQLSTTVDVEVASETDFTLVLSALDKAAVDLLLNANGSSSAGLFYNLAAGEDWIGGADGASLSADMSGNAIVVSNLPPPELPSINSATYDAASNVLTVSGQNFSALDGALNDINVSRLRLEGANGSVTLSSGNVDLTSTTSFSLILNGTDRIAVEGLLNRDGSVGYNLAAQSGWLAAAAIRNDLSDNVLTVLNTALPAITSASYDAATGQLTVNGSGFVRANGPAPDVLASAFSMRGEGGVSYRLSDSADVDIVSESTFTIQLGSADRVGLGQIVNKSGGTATGGAAYGLAAAEDWMAGANPAAALATQLAKGVTASMVALPTITSAAFDNTLGIVHISGTGFAGLAGIGNDILAGKFRITGEGGVQYTLTDSANVELTSPTRFQLILSPTDRAALAALVNADGRASAGGSPYLVTALEDWAAGTDGVLAIAVPGGIEMIAFDTMVAAPPPVTYQYPVLGGVPVIIARSTDGNGLPRISLDTGVVPQSITGLASIALAPLPGMPAYGASLELGLPAGVRVLAEAAAVRFAGDQARSELMRQLAPFNVDPDLVAASDAYLAGLYGRAQSIHTLTISGDTAGPGSGRTALVAGGPFSNESVVLDVRESMGLALQLDHVDLAIMIGPGRVTDGLGNNVLIGDASMQHVALGAGNDTLLGNAGDDVLSGARSDVGQWRFFINANGQFDALHQSFASAGPTKEVPGAELDAQHPLLAFLLAAPARLVDLALFYQAAFARAADVPGLNFWLQGSATSTEIARAFASSDEWTARHAGQTSGEYVLDLYQQVLGRASDAAGVAFWTAQLDDQGSGVGRADLLAAFALSAENRSSVGTLEIGAVMVSDELGWIRDSGNDRLDGGAGNDRLVGGDGIDIAVYAGPLSEYAFSLGADGQLRVTQSASGAVDTLIGIEFGEFGDATINLYSMLSDLIQAAASPMPESLHTTDAVLVGAAVPDQQMPGMSPADWY